MNDTSNNQAGIHACNSLLRGELSAVETYNQAIEKFSGDPACGELTRIRNEHTEAANKLRANVLSMGGEPSTDSGAWGVFAKAIQGSANFLGEQSALQSLQKGEEHGRNDYERAVDSGDVLPECKQMIRTELLPKIRSHIAALERLEG